MKYTENVGIRIDDEVKGFIEKAITLEKSRNHLAQVLDINQASIGFWVGKNQRKGFIISWEEWRKLRNYLAKQNILDPHETRWMLPEEMRDCIEKFRANGSELSDKEKKILKYFQQITDEHMQMTAIDVMQTFANQAAIKKSENTGKDVV